MHMLSLVCIARESTCDQHRANQHCPDRGSGVWHPSRAERKLLLQALTSVLLKSQDCSNC
ncbi:unnamed protein product [Staurois parvus]|uniref:Uncharacterized protein n=1 Tax=Staurois parvus TaxID=386267 RepID=A0ABN9C363_9NEOB|nr:unnamed protein product [Staurois parvus]